MEGGIRRRERSAGSLMVVLPGSLSQDQATALSADIAALDPVERAEPLVTRGGLDPGSLMVWVSFAGDVLALAGPAVAALKLLRDRIRGKGIRGATIELPNGLKISVDSASTEDIQELVKTLGASPG